VCAWAVILLLSPAFGLLDDINNAAVSMLPGLITCLISIVLHRTFSHLLQKNRFVAACALITAFGTFLYASPLFELPLAWRLAGLALSGAPAILIIMTWFRAFSLLKPRTIIALTGITIPLAGLICLALLYTPTLISSLAAALLPLISFAVLPQHSSAYERAPLTSNTPTLSAIFGAAIPARTLFGLAVIFFVVGSLGTATSSLHYPQATVAPTTILVPVGIGIFFFVTGRYAKNTFDLSVLTKILLALTAGVIVLFSFVMGTNTGLILYAHIISETLMWALLCLWANKTPIPNYLVFSFGWIAECLGSVAGQGATLLLAGQPELHFGISLFLVLMALSFAFSEGALIVDLDFAEIDAEEHAEESLTPSTSTITAEVKGAEEASEEPAEEIAEKADPLDTFAETYHLSRREKEVFALWVTGHGMKYLQDALFISEPTVKSHLRNIYRKCDVHNRAEIINLYESMLFRLR
jgi:DNA-binding CsgD family transcriptional regulator